MDMEPILVMLLNKVEFGSNSQDLESSFIVPSAYSMHPNEQGAQAYANCVQAKLMRLKKITEKPNGL